MGSLSEQSYNPDLLRRLIAAARLIVVTLAATLFANGGGAVASPSRMQSVGFEIVSVPNGLEPPLRVGVWYPAIGNPVDEMLEDFTQRVVPDGVLARTNLPLVMLSHGGGGSLGGHYDTALALARAGFVVAAVNHAGDTTGDESKVLQLWRRPQQLSRSITYMLANWRGGGKIDPRRVGAYGFSNGGFTVLAAAGGRPNLALIDPYCRANPKHDLCVALAQAGVKNVGALPVPTCAWRRDDRIRAIAVAAPGFAPVFANGGLRNVKIPVQLWYGADDRHQPGAWYGELILRSLPWKPKLHVVPGAGHYDFLAPCSPSLAKAAPLICTEANGFDRQAFHLRLNAGLVHFFKTSLHAGWPQRSTSRRAMVAVRRAFGRS